MPLGGHQATNDDAGPAINVISWFLVATAVLFVVLRAVTKSLLTRLAADDFLIFTSLVFYIAATIATGFQVDHGLGKSTVPSRLFVGYQKARYTGDIFYIVILAFSKWSTLVFLGMLSPTPTHRSFIKTSTWIVGLWSASSFIVTVFQCKPPHVWESFERDTCINRIAFFTYINVANILFEGVLIAFPINIVARIQTSLSKKALLISCFVARLLVVGSLLAELSFQLSPSFEDATWDNWPAVVARQLINSTSIITACIPYYVSWVPHAFRMYTSVNGNGKGKRLGFIPRAPLFTRKGSVKGDDDPAIESTDETTIRPFSGMGTHTKNSMAIRKTTEWTVRSDVG